MCQEYSEEDDDFVEVEPEEWEMIQEDEKYQTFELWENLQNLYEETLELMSKGFLEKITGDSVESRIATLAKNYKAESRKKIWAGEKIEIYGLNEFISGKAEAYAECLEIVKTHNGC